MNDFELTILKEINLLQDNIIALTSKVERFMREKELEVAENPLKDMSRRAEYIRKLDKMKKVVTDKCTCGEHVGIRFIDEDGTIVEDNMCPLSWWTYKSRLAYLDGKLDEFLETTPIEKYANYGKKDE